MNLAQQALWDRIDQFALDDPDSPYPFSARLAKENGWSRDFAQRVIEEYKRFVFLCLVSDHVACPSEEVDQAWHLHLTYTRSYWDRFCKETLGRPLHHEPTKGGPDQRGMHWQMYERTLRSYREHFAVAPPTDIWPDAETRFAPAHVERVDVGQYWLVPRWPLTWLASKLPPWQSASRSTLTTMGAAAVGLPLLLANWNPLELRGPAFLQLMLGCWLAIMVLWFVLGFLLLRWGGTRKEELDPYEAALLAGDHKTAVLAAVGSLARAEAIEVKPNSMQIYAIKGSLPEGAHALERSVYTAIKGGIEFTAQLFTATRDDTDKIEAKLTEDGFLNSPSAASIVRGVPGTLMFGLLVLGVSKIAVGVSRHKPVEFLIFACIGALISIFIVAQRLRVSWAGRQKLAEQRKKYERLRAAAPAAQDAIGQPAANIAPVDVAMAMGLFGVMALPGLLELDPMRHLLRQNPPPGGWANSNGDGSSGCGTSGCGGGGGCGGGCGGGGCGGCGGD